MKNSAAHRPCFPRPLSPIRLLGTTLLALAFLMPAGWRVYHTGLSQPAGLVSDLATGLIAFGLACCLPRILRAILLTCWSVFLIASMELYGAVHRLPSWQDLGYLSDTTFLRGSMDGLHLHDPWFALLLAMSALGASVLAGRRSRVRLAAIPIVAGLLLLPLHRALVHETGETDIAGRYQPLHWFIADATAGMTWWRHDDAASFSLPPDLSGGPDMDGTPLLPASAARRTRNVLLVVMEGISGIYLPDIRSAAKVNAVSPFMTNLAEATKDAMLVPDFVDHSHQTIRGLYAMHCGDFSKLSYKTPKAFELQNAPDQAQQCLPAQLSGQGWESDYLQGAPLAFMNKDRAMPAMGFRSVHGLEWFTDRTETDFIWGTNDSDFFRGAAKYVTELRDQGKPWFLSLLTVATHQPYAASDEAVSRYGSREAAAVALLDIAVSRFVNDLRTAGVLDDTLVIITSDESHGAEGASWYSSWGTAIVLAPEHKQLPRIKQGTYGLVDIEASVLDYLGLPIPSGIYGRSMFRDYDRGRTMVSYTGGFLRVQDADGRLHECSRDRLCRSVAPARIVAPRPDQFIEDPAAVSAQLFALADRLDNKITVSTDSTLHFGDGQLRAVPDTITNDWTDNLIGAQYLDFPQGSTVTVDIALHAVDAPPDGIVTKLVLRQFEKEIGSPQPPVFPVLHSGESCTQSFSFTNDTPRQAFSFHLLGAGRNGTLRIDRFDVTVHRAQ